MPKLPWIELPLCALAVLAPMIALIARLCIKVKTIKDGSTKIAPRGIGSRLIQLVSVLVIVPVLTILAIENTLSQELIGTLLGSVIGYTLGSLTKSD